VQCVDVVDTEADVVDARRVAEQAQVTADSPVVPGPGREQEQLGRAERQGHAAVLLGQQLETEPPVNRTDRARSVTRIPMLSMASWPAPGADGDRVPVFIVSSREQSARNGRAAVVGRQHHDPSGASPGRQYRATAVRRTSYVRPESR
jgi:hypothetical protein